MAEKVPTTAPEVSQEVESVEKPAVEDLKEDVAEKSGEGDAPKDTQVAEVEMKDPKKDAATSGDIDPYAYLNRDEFTSERFKIEINNLPKIFGIKQLRKRLISIGLNPVKVKTPDCRGYGAYAFATFRCEEDREEALKLLPSHVWKGKTLFAKKASPAADPLLKKRKLEADRDGSASSNKKVKGAEEEVVDPRPIAEILNDTVTPYWRKPYPEQLMLKEDDMKGFVKKIGHQIGDNNWEIKKYLKEQRSANGGLICKFNSIKRATEIDSYRNKCEFTIGTGPDGTQKVVGFRTGSYKSGSVRVVQPGPCVHIPESMKKLTTVCQDYLQNISTLPAYDPAGKDGKWKSVMIRNNRRDHVMCVFEFNPEQATKEDIDKEVQQIKDFFTTGRGKDSNVYSLYFFIKSHRHEKDSEEKYIHISGEKDLQEDLLEMKFRVSPSSFFQVNTPAAEVLYSQVADWCRMSENTILLDVCCGTGTIGLTMAKRVKHVVGIDIIAEAIADAKENAKLNGVENADFYAGKAEDVLPILIRRYYGQDVVAVVDPPRNGLHPRVIQALRKATFIKRLVYVSCKPTEITNNVLDLTRSESRRVKGPFFKLSEVVPVDLFPHTNHCELVLKFDRDGPTKKTADPDSSTKDEKSSTVDAVSSKDTISEKNTSDTISSKDTSDNASSKDVSNSPDESAKEKTDVMVTE